MGPSPTGSSLNLTIGTRGSQLALTQSRWVQARLEDQRGVSVQLEIFSTAGDRDLERPLTEIGGKGLFTEELDRALLDGRIDLAVHSLKDLPTELLAGLELASVPPREDPRDCLIGPEGSRVTLRGLPAGATIGTSSSRRQALVLAFRPDLRVANIRGNVDTRIRKVNEGGYHAIVLAAAGMRRLGLTAAVGEWMEATSWLPAPGQGALGVVGKVGNVRMREILEPLTDDAAARSVRAERAFLAALGGGCDLPIGALGLPYGEGMRLWGLVASPDGRQLVRGDLTGSGYDPEGLGEDLAKLLHSRGSNELLDAPALSVEDGR